MILDVQVYKFLFSGLIEVYINLEIANLWSDIHKYMRVGVRLCTSFLLPHMWNLLDCCCRSNHVALCHPLQRFLLIVYLVKLFINHHAKYILETSIILRVFGCLCYLMFSFTTINKFQPCTTPFFSSKDIFQTIVVINIMIYLLGKL